MANSGALGKSIEVYITKYTKSQLGYFIELLINYLDFLVVGVKYNGNI